MCLTKSGESGKDCKGVAAQKDKRELCLHVHVSLWILNSSSDVCLCLQAG